MLIVSRSQTVSPKEILPTRVRSSPFQRIRRDSTIHRIWKRGHIMTRLHLLKTVWPRLHGFAFLSAITKYEKLFSLDSRWVTSHLFTAIGCWWWYILLLLKLMWKDGNLETINLHFFSHLHVRTAEECENQWYLIDLLKQTLLLPYQKSSDVSP